MIQQEGKMNNEIILVKLIRYFSVIAFLLTVLLYQPSVAYSQTSVANKLTPITLFLLDQDQTFEENLCPEVSSETTFQGDIIIRNQDDLDNLVGITRIDGELRIFNPVFNTLFNVAIDELDFSPLDSLIEVTGDVSFQDTGLTSISGFNCLTTIGEQLLIGPFGGDNDDLVSVSGFDSLVTVRGIDVLNNDSLESLPEFLSLESSDLSINIVSNPNLVRLSGFPLLNNIRGNLVVEFNRSLESISGFSSLENIAVNLLIRANLLDGFTEISGFPLLASVDSVINIGSVEVSNEGFSSLSSIGERAIVNKIIIDCNTIPTNLLCDFVEQ